MKKTNGYPDYQRGKTYEVYPLRLHFKDRQKKEMAQLLMKKENAYTGEINADIILRALIKLNNERMCK